MKLLLNKRNLLTMLLCLSSLFSTAQSVFTKIIHLDRFDDVLSEKDVKTLITKTDSAFIVETKGQDPVEYWYVDSPSFTTHIGSKDSLVNIAADLYGYEERYTAFAKRDWVTITIRTISKYKFTFEYKTDLFWIKFPDGSRYIYVKI